MNWYIGVLKQYAVFSGRSRRKEYWMFTLFNVIISIVLGIINGIVIGEANVLGGLYSLAVLLPAIGVSIRRLHDTGKSGWWLLLAFIPILGAIILIVFMATPGTPGSNEYGPNPKETGGEGTPEVAAA